MTATSRSSSSRWQSLDRSEPTSSDEISRADARRQKVEEARRRQTRFTLITVAGFFVVAVAGVLYWQYEESVTREAAAVVAGEQAALKQELGRFDLNDPAQAQRAVTRLEQSQPQWQKWPTASQFADQLTQARSMLALASARHELDETIQKLEQQVAGHPQELTTLRAMHEQATTLAEKLHADPAKAGNKEAHDRLLACLGSIDTGYLAELQAAITAAAADPRAARTMLAEAEDLAGSKLDAAEQARDAAARAQWQKELLGYAKQEDASVTASYGAEAIDKVAWQDLLPGTKTEDWVHSSGTGIDHVVKGDTIEIAEASGAGSRGGTVVLRSHAWRNCEVEFDASLERGAANIMLRAGKKTDPRMSAAVKFALVASPKVLQLPGDQPVHVDMLVLGDQLTVRVGGEQHQFAIPPAARSGRFAIAIDPSTSLHLSHLRVRDLE